MPQENFWAWPARSEVMGPQGKGGILMAFQILHWDGERVTKFNCLTLKQIKQYLWELRVNPATMITIADLLTMEAVHGNKKTLVNALSEAETTDQLFGG